MSFNNQELVSALIRFGNHRLADLWEVSEAEASRRLSGERNIPLKDFISALDAIKAYVVTDPDSRCIHKDELHALNMLSKRYLDRRMTQNNGDRSDD